MNNSVSYCLFNDDRKEVPSADRDVYAKNSSLLLTRQVSHSRIILSLQFSMRDILIQVGTSNIVVK